MVEQQGQSPLGTTPIVYFMMTQKVEVSRQVTVSILSMSLLTVMAGAAIAPALGGTVLPEDEKGMEHMASFDYAYKLTPVRDWLFEQSKQ